MKPEQLRHLSALLDQALDLAVAERETWIAGLDGDGAVLAPTLCDLLARHPSKETADLLDFPPAFTAAGAAPDVSELCEGDTVGPYRLDRSLGRGGMGEVWLADTLAYRLTRFAAWASGRSPRRRSCWRSDWA